MQEKGTYVILVADIVMATLEDVTEAEAKKFVEDNNFTHYVQLTPATT